MVSEMYQKKWECWKNDRIELEKIELKRYIKPGGFGKTVHISLHSFYIDASELGYEESSYLRLVDEYRHIHCTLLMAKARVTPRKFVSISQSACWSSFSSKDTCLDQKRIRDGGIHGIFLDRWQSCSGVYCQRFQILQNICSKQGESNSRIQTSKSMELPPIRGQSS